MPSTQRKGRFLLGTSLVGLVVFFALSGMTQLVAPFRVLLFSPFVQVLVVLAAVGMGTVFLLWGRLPGGGDPFLTGADLRDADLRGADLTKSIFLIQSQLDAAKGDTETKLSPPLTRPTHWYGVE